MASSVIPVDLRNPGQVIASLGFAEAAEALLGATVRSAFHGDSGSTRVEFFLETDAASDPIRELIQMLRGASVAAVIPRGSTLSTKKWSVAEVVAPGLVSPSPVPRTPATLPARLECGERSITLSSWADGPHSGLDNAKLWAGAGGYPGAALARDILQLIAEIHESDIDNVVLDPFAYSTPMTSSFRLDWRRDYIPLDAGFSPNQHGDVTMVGYPFTELFGAIGLRYARPKKIDKLHYRYGTWGEPLPNALARPVLGAVDIGVPIRNFEMILGWPGKEGQARCIIDAREDL